MKLFYSTDFTGFWPVGTAALVLAASKERAEKLLNDDLLEIGLKFDGTLHEVSLEKECAIILRDGDY